MGNEEGGKSVTDEELMMLPKIKPEHAAKYLQDGTTAQEIRVKAQYGVCPFCVAEKRTPNSRRHTYRINPGLLRAYKAGQLGNGMAITSTSAV